MPPSLTATGGVSLIWRGQVCSLQKKAAGMNLQCANHVLLVHPFFAPNREHAAAWEAQAIGRVLRPGQAKTVHVHRFLALGTIEQELVVAAAASEAEGGGWRSFFQRQQNRCQLPGAGGSAK
jgi:hypothetical protein